MTPAAQLAALAAADCEVAFDNPTRQLYATDASPYQIEPLAVAFPINALQSSAIIKAAAQAGVPVSPRGAGTGLSGGALGDGLVVDFTRHNRRISHLNLDQRTVRVGPGVVLDQLNDFLRPSGLGFGPDVATSSRATLGGMLANDSSGSHTPVYGTTGMHVRSLEVILSDGSYHKITATDRHCLQPQRHLVEDLVALNSLVIAERFPPGLLKRWPGYALARAAEAPGNMLSILTGSEGTLAAIVGAELNLIELPEERGVGLLFFDSVTEAMQAALELSDLHPAAVEHIDRPLFEQTRGQREFQAARDLLELDARPCESILLVEFFENAADKLALLAHRKLGRRRRILTPPAEAALVWNLRKAGLSLLTSCRGAAKPACFIEDAAVRPGDLPAYVAGLQQLMARQSVTASYYGHAAAGLLHVRPVLDLHSPADLEKFRAIADEVSALVAQFKGSLAAEHGVGIARTEFLKAQVGPVIYGLMRQIKNSFDPHNIFNPGKIIGDGRYYIDRRLRLGAHYELKLPFEPRLAFAARDGSFTGNLEQCNGCGGCLKHKPTMCPTYLATGDEFMSTRGRANLIRSALERRGGAGDPLTSPEMSAALENCLSCRACATECPSNVNLALLKAELLHAVIQQEGLTFRDKFLSSLDRVGKIGCTLPSLTNGLLGLGWIRRLTNRYLGLAPQRTLPRFARQRFDHWMARQPVPPDAYRGPVMLWDDTFVRYHEPEIGRAAVQVLQAAGYDVILPEHRKCCGRPAFSLGNLDEAAALGRHNLALLQATDDGLPIVFLEPSCHSMFMQDYLELKLPGAEGIARRCHSFEQFVGQLLAAEPSALRFNRQPERLTIHAHCHARALAGPDHLRRLAEHLPERTVTLLDTGCCGMAGAFGAQASKYALSLKIAAPLMDLIKSQPFGNTVVASGTSCRHQIEHLSVVRTRHMAEVLADALG
jgi:FAD/FMN-containing dehydrogenase/Fe-S oxidoreductase